MILASSVGYFLVAACVIYWGAETFGDSSFGDQRARMTITIVVTWLIGPLIGLQVIANSFLERSINTKMAIPLALGLGILNWYLIEALLDGVLWAPHMLE